MNALTATARVNLPTEENPAPTLSLMPVHGCLMSCPPKQAVAKGILTTEDIPALKAYLCEASRLAEPCAPDRIVVHVVSLLQHYPQSQSTTEATQQRLRDWVSDLADVPEDWIGAACAKWRRSQNRFAPSPGQLLALIHEKGVRKTLASRAAEVLDLLGAKP